MKVKIMEIDGTLTNDIEISENFLAPFRPDVIKKAFLVFMSWTRQPYGSDPKAGMKHSAQLSRRRKSYRGSYGHGISRVPRKIMMRSGMRMYWVGAVAAGTVGGREPHHPKVEKIWYKNINKKEYAFAIRSAIAAGLNKDIIKIRGHEVPDTFPFVLSSKFDDINTAKEFENALVKIGFENDLERAKVKKIRAGMGKNRGRPYKKRKSVLIITGNEDSKLFFSGNNIPGVEVVHASDLEIADLVPGNMAGRPILFVESALKNLE